MDHVTSESLDPQVQSVKYILLQLPHPIGIPSSYRPKFRIAGISGQTHHDQCLNARGLFVNPQWPIFAKLQAEIPSCTMIALLTESPFRINHPPPSDIAERRQRDRRRCALEVVKNFIDESLALETLDVTLIGHQFGMSRSSVYRLFESECGLANYIRRCRLLRALSLLVSPPTGARPRILDIAIECGFSSDMVFTRAFRKMFLWTPSAVRSMAEHHAPEFSELLTRLRQTRLVEE